MNRHDPWKIKHGKCGTKVYRTWATMKDRCLNKNCRLYKYYGARGITVCKEWESDFENFYKDMGDPPTDKHSIDRIDVNKGYYKDNCRWATDKQQANNRTNTVYIQFDGVSKTISEWSKEVEIHHNAIRTRLRRGWSVEKTLLTPVRCKRSKGEV